MSLVCLYELSKRTPNLKELFTSRAPIFQQKCFTKVCMVLNLFPDLFYTFNTTADIEAKSNHYAT